MSIPLFPLFLYLPAPAKLLSLCPQLAVLPQQFPSSRNPRSISLSLRYSNSSLIVFTLLQASFCSEATQYTKASDSCSFQAALAFICVMTSSCGSVGWFAILVSWKWWKVLFWRIEHSCLCWLWCWATCWMLQDMDYMEASCIIYVKVGLFDQLE